MKKATGLDFLVLALLAFGGIGLEVILALGIEPILYGAQLGEWSTLQNILHFLYLTSFHEHKYKRYLICHPK